MINISSDLDEQFADLEEREESFEEKHDKALTVPGHPLNGQWLEISTLERQGQQLRDGDVAVPMEEVDERMRSVISKLDNALRNVGF